MRKKQKIIRERKGDAIILLSVAITGIVMLVSVMAIEKLKQSTKLQNTQKMSLQNTYQAEEGIEFSLFSAKEGVTNLNANSTNTNAPLNRFQVSLWDNNNKSEGVTALEQIAGQTTKDRYIIASKNKVSNTNQNTDKKLQKSAFSNVPTRFYNQVSLWNNMKDDCNAKDGQNNCSDIDISQNDMNESDKTYQVVSRLVDYQNNWGSVQYRVILTCTNLKSDCSVKNLKIKWENCTTASNTCPITCNKSQEITFGGGKTETSGLILVSDWFTVPDNLQTQTVVFEFSPGNTGKLSEIKIPGDTSGGNRCDEIFGKDTLSSNFCKIDCAIAPEKNPDVCIAGSKGVKMCKGSTAFTDRRGGIVRIDVKKAK